MRATVTDRCQNLTFCVICRKRNERKIEKLIKAVCKGISTFLGTRNFAEMEKISSGKVISPRRSRRRSSCHS
jgi:hypothetical protein